MRGIEGMDGVRSQILNSSLSPLKNRLSLSSWITVLNLMVGLVVGAEEMD